MVSVHLQLHLRGICVTELLGHPGVFESVSGVAVFAVLHLDLVRAHQVRTGSFKVHFRNLYSLSAWGDVTIWHLTLVVALVRHKVGDEFTARTLSLLNLHSP
jgi:hypothetical protein